MKSHPTLPRLRQTVHVLLAVCSLAPASAAMAQQCLSMKPQTLFDTSSNCSSEPAIDRTLGSMIIRWKDRDYLFGNIGNEIRIWRIDSPQEPVLVGDSSFRVPNQGDSDYDLMAFSVSNDNRYGAAWYKMATVLFDLGTADEPIFTDHNVIFGATFTFGGVTFSHGGNRYLATASGVQGSCDGVTTLFEFGGILEPDLTNIGCVHSDDRSILASGGHYVDGHLYLGDASTRVYLFEVEDQGGSIVLNYLSQPMRARFGKHPGLAFDDDAGIAVETNNQGAAVWDISSPGSPVKRGTIGGSFDSAAVAHPVMFVAQAGVKNTERTYDISNIDAPIQIDPGFWDGSHSWNHPGHNCSMIQAGSFSPGGSTLYLSRYSWLQMGDMTACVGPIARVTVDHAPVFPNETVLISNTSIGEVDRHAVWINTSRAPHGSATVAGSDSLTDSTPADLAFTVPIDVRADVRFWAHVAIESDEFPYSARGSTPGQVDTAQVVVDRSPAVRLELSPTTPVTGNDLTIAASADGTPSDPNQLSAYQWTVTSPSLQQTQSTDESVDLSLAEGGDWIVDLVVHYSHEQSTGVYYDAELQELLQVSSVFADFTVNPGSPFHTEPIFLDARSSAVGPGATPSFEWVITGPSSYSCASGPSASTCTIPQLILSPGSYDVQLTLTDTASGDVSVKLVENVQVAAGIQLDLSWSPANPDVGDLITYRIEGAAGSITSAAWDFGGSSCPGSGYNSQITCVPDIDSACDQQPYSYSSPGPKTVTLSVNVDGTTFGPVQQVVSVGSTGSCASAASFTWIPAAPEIGELVHFDVTNAPGIVSQARWTFAEPGCSGFPTTYTCTPLFTDCKAYGHKFSRSGNHVVSLELIVNGAILPLIQRTVPVSNLGWCPGGAGLTGIWERVHPSLDQSSSAATAMATFGSFLYVGTKNAGSGFELVRSANGRTWQRIAGEGLGDPGNSQVTALHAFSGWLYLATENNATGCEIWRTLDGLSWSQVGLDGFGSSDTTSAPAMTSYGGDLYVGTTNTATGAQIWRTTGDHVWTQENTAGFGTSQNDTVTSVQGFGAELYAGSTGFWGFRLFRRADGTTWDQVGLDGFGDNSNLRVSALAKIDGLLHLGTGNALTGGEYWTSSDGASWTQLLHDGFDGQQVNQEISFVVEHLDRTVIGLSNPQLGGIAWSDNGLGTTWEALSGHGFGDQYNVGLTSAAVFNDMLYIGTENPFGLQLWRLNPDLLFGDGFERGSTAAWAPAGFESTATATLDDGVGSDPSRSGVDCSGCPIPESSGFCHTPRAAAIPGTAADCRCPP